MLQRVLEHLEALVAVDTANPPRDIQLDRGAFAHARQALEATFSIESGDLGDGCVWLLARRGRPRILFNVHLDTVPAAEGWSSDPLQLRIDNGRAVGLGACDVKGAAACLLAAAERADGDAALLFTSDEEAGESRCVRCFIESVERNAFDLVIVSEPTGGRAVVAHRGLVTGAGEFSGTAGHSSSGRALHESAVHEALRWGAAALEYAGNEEREAAACLRGIALNVGRVEGGIKPNMIATSAHVRWSARPRPGQSAEDVRRRIEACAADPHRVRWTQGFDGPSLPARHEVDQLKAARAWAAKLALDVAPAVNFWTEAALFSEAGFPALVFGPGAIDQAHAPDEWVALAELERVAQFLARLLS